MCMCKGLSADQIFASQVGVGVPVVWHRELWPLVARLADHTKVTLCMNGRKQSQSRQ